MSKSKAVRILAFDTSMKRPGAAVVEVAKGKPKIVALSHVTTDAKHSHGLRAKQIEAWALLFIGEHIGAGFTAIVREDFQGRSSRQNHPVFAAWSAIDRALHTYGLEFTDKAISQSAVKKAVVGVGRAEKDDVAQAVRKLTGYKGEFACDDESDAAGIALAWAIQAGLIYAKGSD